MYERLLRGILGELEIAQQRVGIPHRHVLEATHDLAVCAAVSLRGSCDEVAYLVHGVPFSGVYNMPHFPRRRFHASGALRLCHPQAARLYTYAATRSPWHSPGHARRVFSCVCTHS